MVHTQYKHIRALPLTVSAAADSPTRFHSAPETLEALSTCDAVVIGRGPERDEVRDKNESC